MELYYLCLLITFPSKAKFIVRYTFAEILERFRDVSGFLEQRILLKIQLYKDIQVKFVVGKSKQEHNACYIVQFKLESKRRLIPLVAFRQYFCKYQNETLSYSSSACSFLIPRFRLNLSSASSIFMRIRCPLIFHFSLLVGLINSE